MTIPSKTILSNPEIIVIALTQFMDFLKYRIESIDDIGEELSKALEINEEEAKGKATGGMSWLFIQTKQLREHFKSQIPTDEELEILRHEVDPQGMIIGKWAT